ncbi:MAG TPA: coenzyme F420-0:L-glutamate ligase [Patescibacteria group bacterium]|nr:coenzyme F420-0:L-glutamate ligase [Patescibacteria group bacterium]
MIARAIRTRKVTPSACTIFELLDESITEMKEQSILVITSKVISLCEGRVAPIAGTDLQALVREEAEQYMPEAHAQHGYTFTIAHNMLTPNSGIDESNADGQYVLWPSDPQASANAVREYLCERFKLQDVGVVIADGDFIALRWGAIGLALAYSGFEPVRHYADQVDLFGRPLLYTRTNIMDAIATSATLLMGEGAEQTPLALFEDLPPINFQRRNPTAEELAGMRATLAEDSYAPLLQAVTWKDGGRKTSP